MEDRIWLSKLELLLTPDICGSDIYEGQNHKPRSDKEM